MSKWSDSSFISAATNAGSTKKIPGLAFVSLLMVFLIVGSASYAQNQGEQQTLDTIRSQVRLLNSLLANGQISQQTANEQLKALQVQAGELALNVTAARVPTQSDTVLAENRTPGKATNTFSESESLHSTADLAGSAVPAAAKSAALASGASPAPAPVTKTETDKTNPNATCVSLCDLPMTHFRGLIGVNVSGASAADPSAKFYANVAFEEPLGGSFNSSTKPAWLSAWGNFGLSSVSQPGSLSGVTSAYSYLQSAVNTSPQQIVQSMETQVGLAINPPKFQWYHDKSKSMQSLSFILGGGLVTPLSPSQSAPPLFAVTQSVVDAYLPQNPSMKSACNLDSAGMLPANQKCYVAFFPQDRTRFFRDYGAGIRLKFYWADSNVSKGISPNNNGSNGDSSNNWLRFPGNIDLAIGQSEYVTGGGLNGAVLHLGYSMPVIPIDGLYVFGSMDVGLSKGAASKQPLLLQPSSNPSLTYTDPSIVAIQAPQPNRDRYTVGMGIDLVDFIKHFGQNK